MIFLSLVTKTSLCSLLLKWSGTREPLAVGFSHVGSCCPCVLQTHVSRDEEVENDSRRCETRGERVRFADTEIDCRAGLTHQLILVQYFCGAPFGPNPEKVVFGASETLN